MAKLKPFVVGCFLFLCLVIVVIEVNSHQREKGYQETLERLEVQEADLQERVEALEKRLHEAKSN